MKKTPILAAATLACAMSGTLAAPALAQDKVTLTFSHTNLPFLQSVVDGFTKSHPDIEIVDQAPAENYSAGDQAVIRGLMTNSAPDLYLASYSSIKSLADILQDRGRAVPLDPFLQAEGNGWAADNHAEAVLALGQVEGTQYAMPFTASLPLVYVNADLVAQAGGDMADFPADWDGLIDLAAQISELGDDTTGISFSVGGLSDDWYWQMMVMAAGEDMLNADESGIGYDNAAGMEALRITRDMATKTGMSVYATPTPAQQQFFAGKVGMVIQSPSDLVAYQTAVGDRFEMRTERFPMIDPEGGLPSGGNALMILSEDEAKQAAAWEFVKYMTGAQAQAEVSKASGYMPTNKHAAEALADFYEENPNFQTVFNSMDAAAPWFAYPNNTGGDIWQGVAPVLDQLQRGNLTPEEAMAKLRDHVAAVLAMQ